MIERVISGFQSGADIGGIRAAMRYGIPTGGWMPHGFLTEAGPRPEYASLYGAWERVEVSYPPRTWANVRDSDLTIWFDWDDEPESKGFRCTRNATSKLKKPLRIVGRFEPATTPGLIARELGSPAGLLPPPRVLNVAGGRESRCPGIGAWVESYMGEVFRLLVQNEVKS